MIGELRNVQRSRLRHDGYASDSAVLDDDDDVWTVNPMHGQVRQDILSIYAHYVAETLIVWLLMLG